jgi:hypothetical protein
MSSAARATTIPVRAATRPTAAVWLERALLFAFVAHGLAMLAMALLLLPGVPGGPNGPAARMAYVAAHPWLWRLGWLPWQLTALADLALAVALVATAWVPRPPALLTLLVTLAALVPDQLGQALWISRGVALARAGDLAAYGAFEARTFVGIAALGGLGYTLAAAGWSWSLAAAGTWARWLTSYSVALWALFAGVNGAQLLPAVRRPTAGVLAAGNALGFILLLVWLAAVAELVLRRARPVEAYGRDAPWRHPSPWLAWALDPVANSRFVRALCDLVPMPPLRSDIADVVYVNYLVPAERLAPLVPPGLELQRLGPEGRHALFSFLTYRHGHLGPALLGPLRRLLFSPVQSNWRIYVRLAGGDREGVYFPTTALSNTPMALAARLFAEGLPMHVPRRAALRRGPDGAIRLLLDPGRGTAPDAAAELRPSAARPTDGPWRAAFATYAEMLAYCVPQDRALAPQPWCGRVLRQEIRLGIPLEACEPLEGTIASAAARGFVGDAAPFAFGVRRVKFVFQGEHRAATTSR